MGLTKGSKKKFAGIQKHAGKKRKTKRYYRDIDQIHEDIKPENKVKLLNQPKNIDLPGDGQNYCLHCARHFVDQHSLTEHFRSKVHKKRLKELKETPYTQEEAERASGMGNYIPPKKIKVSTELPVSNIENNTQIMS